MRSNGRIRRRRVPPLARLYGAWLRAYGAVAPARADRALSRRFQTPSRRRGAPAADVYDRAFGTLHRGRRIPVWTGGTGPRVLLAHGWESHGAFWDPLARELSAAGYAVATFDMPAHGVAGGGRTNVFDMAETIRAVARETGPLAAVIGHSAGASAAAIALREGLDAGRAVLIAPPALPATFMFPLAEALGLRHERALAALAAMERELGRDPFDADTVTAAAALRIPGLVIHDHDDGRARWEEGRAVADSWHGSRLLSTAGLGHYRVAADPAVIDEVIRFLQAGAAARRTG